MCQSPDREYYPQKVYRLVGEEKKKKNATEITEKMLSVFVIHPPLS